MDQKQEQAIRERAYLLWLEAGKPEGSHLRFWKQAEAQLLGESTRPPKDDDNADDK